MEDSIKSKTQLKKEADDIQHFGIEISNLPNDQTTLAEYIDEFQPDLTNLNQTINAARREYESNKKSKNYKNLYRIILADIKKLRSAP